MDISDDLRRELAHKIGMATREVVAVKAGEGGFTVTLHTGDTQFIEHPAAAKRPAPPPGPVAEAKPRAPRKKATS